jgi:hypothetical protein
MLSLVPLEVSMVKDITLTGRSAKGKIHKDNKSDETIFFLERHALGKEKLGNASSSGDRYCYLKFEAEFKN